MPSIDVLDIEGKFVDKMDLSDSIFGISPNVAVMHMAVVNYLANQRQGTQSTLTRSEVQGGGKKPWRQKGTGRARQGSIRAPQWRHGGIALGPKPRSYRFSLNKKVKRLALKSALSSKVASNDFIVLDNLYLDDYKTQNMVKIISNLGINQKTLLIMPGVDDKIKKSAANIPYLSTTLVNTINVYDILNHEKLIILKEAVNVIENTYSS